MHKLIFTLGVVVVLTVLAGPIHADVPNHPLAHSGDMGPALDPDGRHAHDMGPLVDPDGRQAHDMGPFVDPDGRQVHDMGPLVDPNGRAIG